MIASRNAEFLLCRGKNMTLTEIYRASSHLPDTTLVYRQSCTDEHSHYMFYSSFERGSSWHRFYPKPHQQESIHPKPQKHKRAACNLRWIRALLDPANRFCRSRTALLVSTSEPGLGDRAMQAWLEITPAGASFEICNMFWIRKTLTIM